MGVFHFSSSDNTPTNSAAGIPSDKKSRIRNYVALAAAGVFISAGVVATASPAPDNKPLKNTKHESTITLKSSSGGSTIVPTQPDNATASVKAPAKEQSGTSASTNSSNTVTINNETISLPANGTVTREFTDENGQTSLEASSTSTNTTGGNSTSTLDINISTDSNSWRVSEDNP